MPTATSLAYKKEQAYRMVEWCEENISIANHKDADHFGVIAEGSGWQITYYGASASVFIEDEMLQTIFLLKFVKC